MKTPLIYALFVAFLSGSPQAHPPSPDSTTATTRAEKAAARANAKAAPTEHGCPNSKGDQG